MFARRLCLGLLPMFAWDGVSLSQLIAVHGAIVLPRDSSGEESWRVTTVDDDELCFGGRAVAQRFNRYLDDVAVDRCVGWRGRDETGARDGEMEEKKGDKVPLLHVGEAPARLGRSLDC